MLPAGLNAVELGRAPVGGAVRLSFAPKGVAAVAPEARVYCDGRLVARSSSSDPLSWTEVRRDLSGLAGADCRVVFDSSTPLWVATCELTPRDLDRPNVLVVLIDTLRPDHLGCYGYERATSPNMDALAADGVLFHDAFSQASWTRPAVGTLFTGTYPTVHGAIDRPDLLRQDLPTLAQAFRDHAYETVAFVSNPSVLPVWGFGPGFTRYSDVDSMAVDPGRDKDVMDAGIAALDYLAGRPWLMYLHAIGPHSPYDPPAPYSTRFASESARGTGELAERSRTVDLYDGEIAFTDAHLGRLIDRLKSMGQYDNTLIVVMADHGEEFWEHGGLGHGTTLYDEQIRIPLIMKLPARRFAGEVRHGITQLMDVGPTLLDLAGIPVPPSFQGSSFRTLIERGDADLERPAYASLFLEQHRQYAARTLEYKYIRDTVSDTRVWFDLAVDTHENHPLGAVPPTAEALAAYASRIVATSGSGLHVLVTGSLRDPHEFELDIQASGLETWRLRYPARNGTVTPVNGGLRFRLVTAPGPDCPPGLIEWTERGGEPNNAHLLVQTGADSPITITARLDAKPMPVERLRLGADQRPAARSEMTFLPREVIASSDRFDPVVLPPLLAAYIWYVPTGGSVPDDALDRQMLDALESLGYL